MRAHKCLLDSSILVLSTLFIIFPINWESKSFFQKSGKIFSMNDLFCERLKDLRKEKGLGQIALAEKLDVGKSVISLWELGKCEPKLSSLVAMAKFFDVTIDYLAGLED